MLDIVTATVRKQSVHLTSCAGQRTVQLQLDQAQQKLPAARTRWQLADAMCGAIRATEASGKNLVMQLSAAAAAEVDGRDRMTQLYS